MTLPFITDCAENREFVNYKSIDDGSFSVTYEPGNVGDNIFDQSGEGNPVNVGSNSLTINIDLGESGVKKLIGLTLTAINVKEIRVAATEDSPGATESPERVSISHWKKSVKIDYLLQ